MSQKLIYLTHARIPSEKTPSPFILKTCESFVKEGWDVELWVARRQNPQFVDGDPFSDAGIARCFPILYVPVIDRMALIGRVGFALMVAAFNVAVAYRVWCHRKEPVVFYAHDLRDVILPLLVGASVVCEIHDFFESSVPFLNRFALSRVRALVVTNSIKARLLREKYHVPEERILVQPNAVAVEQFDIPLSRAEARMQLALSRETLLVMYTGHLYAWKGVETLAEASAFLPENTVVYFVGGTESDRAVLQKLVAQKSLPRIEFVPHQEHAKIPLFLKAANVLVLPNTGKENVSKYETSPVKLFEYLASGTPIVASDLPSIREIVSEREVCFAEADNPRDFARAIQTVLQGRHDTRSKYAQALAHTHTWEARAKAISQFMRDRVD